MNSGPQQNGSHHRGNQVGSVRRNGVATGGRRRKRLPGGTTKTKERTAKLGKPSGWLHPIREQIRVTRLPSRAYISSPNPSKKMWSRVWQTKNSPNALPNL